MLLFVFGLSLTACGNGESNVDDSSSNTALAELQEKYDALTQENSDLKTEIENLNKTIEDLNLKTSGSIVEPENGTPIYNDEYVSISFLGCEIDNGDECLVFFVENLTGVELSFQSDSLSIDGYSLGNPFGSDTIAAKSKGKIRFETKESFPNMSPEKISGTLNVIDFNKTLFGKLSYDISFVDVEISK